MKNQTNQLSDKELYKRLDEALPGGSYEPAKKDSRRRLYFTRISMQGLEEMHEYSTDERLYQYFEYDPFKTIGDTRQYLQKLISLEGDEPFGRTAICWFVRRINDNSMVGTARLVNIEISRQSVEWGYGLDPKLWGEGYILEIQEILKEYVFDTLKFNRLWGGSRIDNEPAKSSLLAAGVNEEGIFRQALRDSKGHYHDVWRYSILAEDYSLDKHLKPFSPIGEMVTKESIAKIVGQALGHSEIDISDDMSSVSSWDSLNHINVILKLEESTGYKFSPIEISQAISIENIFSIIKKI